MNQDTIQRLALGTPISLGYLYNACEDKPCNMCVLTEYPPPPSCVNSVEIQNTSSDFVHEKSMSDKFSRLDVAAELKLSLCAGLINVSGSGEYFKDVKNSERVVSVSLIHKITTAHEDMNILDKKLRDVINLDALMHTGATHVVTGVTWGGNLVITMKYENSERKDEQKIAGRLQAELKKFSIDLQGSAKVDFGDGDNADKSKFTLKIVGDVNTNGPFPTTIEDAMRLMEQLPPLVKAQNHGKGVPIRYNMISLEAIRSYFGFNVKIESVLRAIEEETILRMVTMFDAVNNAKTRMNDLCEDVNKYEDHLPEDMVSEVMELRDEAAVAESNFKTKLRTLLVRVRSGQAEVCELDELRKYYDSSAHSPKQTLRKLQSDFRAVKAKIELISSLQKLGVILVPSHTEALSNKLLELGGKKAYILFGESEAIIQNNAEWNKHLNKFSTLMVSPEASKNLKFMYIDLDAAKHLQPTTQDGQMRKILLQRFDEYGQCEASDVMNGEPVLAPKPKVEKPKVEKPKVEYPKVEYPKVEKPKVEKPKVAKPKVASYSWVAAANGEVPENAVVGGYEGGDSYVVRARIDGHLIPGKVFRNCYYDCFVPYDGSEHRVSTYEVLVAPPGTVGWVPSRNGEHVQDAIIGGREQNGSLYYVGRFRVEGVMIPGKVQLEHKKCYVPYYRREIGSNEYEILVSKS